VPNPLLSIPESLEGVDPIISIEARESVSPVGRTPEVRVSRWASDDFLAAFEDVYNFYRTTLGSVLATPQIIRVQFVITPHPL